MPSNRQIDSDMRTRGKPMRVLVLGMCRTGTTSISVALRKLGYTPHQMRDVLLRPKEIALWQEAVDLTLLSKSDGKAQQRPYGKAEFDKLLSDYDAVMDIPGCIFAKELIHAYPDAKVILTKRDYSDWETSMQESIWCLDTWNLFVLCRVLNLTQLAPLMRLIHSIFKAHNNNEYGGEGAMKSYGKHNDMVRELVPKERLLEIDSDGVMEWQPLCKFLGNEVPRDPFPQLNEEKAMRKYLENAWWGLVQYIVLMIVLPGLVTIGGFFAYTYADDIRGFRDEQILGPLKAYLDA